MAGTKKGSSGSGKRGRDAKTGQFVPQRTVRRRPDTTINETVRKRKKGK